MGEFSNTAGCAIESDYIYLARRYDEFDISAQFTRMSFYDRQDAQVPWKAHDLNWRTVSVCVWRGVLNIPRLYVALSTEGDVELIGPAGNPKIVEHIPGAGLSKPDSHKQGFMIRVRQIGTNLFACGSGFLTYTRTPTGWHDITRPSDRDTMVGQHYLDINGFDENEVVAVGPDSFSTSRVAVYDGTSWRSLLEGYPDKLTTITPSASGRLYIGGWNSVMHGDARQGFSTVVTKDRLFVTGMAEFQGQLYLATTSGLFHLSGSGTLARVYTDLKPDLTDVSDLDAVDDVLWVFGLKDIAFFNGTTWTRLRDPDNSP